MREAAIAFGDDGQAVDYVVTECLVPEVSLSAIESTLFAVSYS